MTFYITPGDVIESRLLLKAILGKYETSIIAKKLGVSKSSVSYWISGGRRMSEPALIRLRDLCLIELGEDETREIMMHKYDLRSCTPRILGTNTTRRCGTKGYGISSSILPL